MGYSPSSNAGTINTLDSPNLDCNGSNASNILELGEHSICALHVHAVSGTHATHVLQVECSPNATDWEDMVGKTITGTGLLSGFTCASQYVRVRVSTVEGGASVVDIHIQAK